jgi:hypothetical protein
MFNCGFQVEKRGKIAMQKREVVRLAFQGLRPPYVPWHCQFTVEAQAKLAAYFGADRWEEAVDNHFLELGSAIGSF